MRVVKASESLNNAMLKILSLEGIEIAIWPWYFNEFFDSKSHIFNQAIS